MKIVFLTHDLNPKTGGGRYASDLINGIKKLGHDVVVLKEIDDGYEGRPVLKKGLGILSAVMRTIFLSRGCDIIHALDGYPYAVIAALANILLRKKLVVTAQGTYAIAPLRNFKTRHIVKWSYRQADAIIAISGYTKKLVQEVVACEVVVINHGVDLEKFFKQRLPSEEKFLLGVGGLKERKGYDVSIRAFSKIAREFPELKYYIVGDRDVRYFEELNDIIRENKIEGRVVFLEKISDERLGELYQKALAFILTPFNQDERHFEGFGLVYLEAAAAGLPIVGTLGNGGQDAIWNGENGILVPQQDVDATADALRKIVGDASLAEQMSQKSFQWAKQHDEREVIKKYSQIYQAL